MTSLTQILSHTNPTLEGAAEKAILTVFPPPSTSNHQHAATAYKTNHHHNNSSSGGGGGGGGGGGLSRKRPRDAVDEAAEWRKFSAWLEELVTPPPPSSSSAASSSSSSSSSKANGTSTGTGTGISTGISHNHNHNHHLDLSPFDVLIDGANVGYYKKNFAAAPKHIDYRQVAPCSILPSLIMHPDVT